LAKLVASRDAAPESVTEDQRVALLRGVSALAALPDPLLDYLASCLHEERHAAGTVVVAEGEVADRLFVVAAGQAEVTAAGSSGPVPPRHAGPRRATPELPGDVLQRALHVPWWQRALLAARKVVTWQTAIGGLDPLVTRLYAGGGHLLYTRPAQAALLLLIVVGLVAFFSGGARVSAALAAAGPALLLFLIPANLFGVLVHEAGHALTVKAFGREVPRGGIGWYWFGPIAFVDTSDMWLADRWPRIAVSLAGGYANLVLAACAALGALVVPDLVWAAALWQFAFYSYWMVTANLNPLLEFDGYYVLSDWLDRPNLRPRAMAWLGHELLPALRTPGGLRGHTLDLLYGVGSVLYVVLMGVLTVVIYRVTLQHWLAQVLPAPVAAGLVWIAAALVVLSAGGALLGELRAARPTPGR